MSERTDKDFLIDIREAINRVIAYTAGMSYAVFLTDLKTQDAVIRNMEIIGEAAKNLSHELRTKYPTIPWKSMAGMRDRLIHHYFGVNLDVVWHIANSELPAFISQLEAIEDNAP
jgi:uncharacterized protein with HEPN domain